VDAEAESSTAYGISHEPARPDGSRAVPLNDRVDHPEQEPGWSSVYVRADVTIALGLLDQVRDEGRTTSRVLHRMSEAALAT